MTKIFGRKHFYKSSIKSACLPYFGQTYLFYSIALPPVTIQHAKDATNSAPVKTFPVILYIIVQINENTITCGANTIRRDIKGPPKVGEKSKSAPGPIPKKNGMYSIKITIKIPPTIASAL